MKHIKIVAGVVVAVLIGTACGGGGSSDSGGGPSPQAQAAETTTSTTAVAGDQTPTSTASPTTVQRGATSTPSTTKRTTNTTAKKTIIAPVSKAVTASPSGGIGNVTSQTTTPDESAQPGGTATVLKSTESPGFDPIQMNNSPGTDGWPGQAVFDYLVYTDGGAVKAGTADSLTSTDGSVWTLKVRPNIRFTDGTAYDATAVRFNLLRLQDPANAALRAPEANSIAAMDVVDAQTLKITLKTKNAVFPQILSLMPFVGSPKAIQEKGTAFSSSPIGAGPFTLKSWVRDSQMTLVRNPGYWNAPQPYLDQLIFRPIGDDTQRANGFCAGEANLMYSNSVDTTQQINDRKCGTLNPSVINGGRMIFLNLKKAPFTDLRVRQAVQLGIDRGEYTKLVDNGTIPPANSIYSPSSPFFDPTSPQPSYDPTKAQQLFDQVAADTGSPVSFTIRTYNVPAYVKGVTYLQSVLNKYRNVKVEVEPLSTTVQVTNIAQGNFQAALYGQAFEDPDPIWLTRFTCDTKTTGFCDTRWDQAVTDSRAALDANQRIGIVKDAQKLLLRDVPVTVLEQLYTWVITAPNIQGFVFVTAGNALWNRIWIKTH